ncbi:membrane associated rhomboid family serine protease [Lewinella marina]|uniref:Rhomboid family intramembrane serine protease n=1 Tax=Neolewinella marina TaxID=438751 RepID=A0A2G0CFA4_9BACT|nr:rhomboid family intramembrane serine protease [Neolewinella marina]NJB85674.1 membrane associated rhomboid family serine protease [Neolewinella marina]PHK98645.1 rhomboid family intramembrane serine protease [Neolewinella marina]
MTLIIILITVLISWQAFNNSELRAKLIFLPAAIKNRGEYYRFLTHGFIHADFQHLLFNMYALYIFGGSVEFVFTEYLFGDTLGKLAYLVFYLVAIVAASVPDYLRHQDNRMYASLGASGGVAATIWPYVMLAPWNWFIFPPLPAILLGIGYILYSHYADKRGQGNIGHNAHLWGAIFGLIAYSILVLAFEPALMSYFLQELMQPKGPNF